MERDSYRDEEILSIEQQEWRMVFTFCLGSFGTSIVNVPAYFIFLLLLSGAPFYFGVSKRSLSEKKKYVM
jgi:hypothetical protein